MSVRYMRVNLRGAARTVAQKLLNLAQIRAIFRQICGNGMLKRMNTYVLFDFYFCSAFSVIAWSYREKCREIWAGRISSESSTRLGGHIGDSDGNYVGLLLSVQINDKDIMNLSGAWGYEPGRRAVAQSPILNTTITLSRLRRKGYESMLSYYLKTQPSIQWTAVYSLPRTWFGETRTACPALDAGYGGHAYAVLRQINVRGALAVIWPSAVYSIMFIFLFWKRLSQRFQLHLISSN